jgi:hypothetical protein
MAATADASKWENFIFGLKIERPQDSDRQPFPRSFDIITASALVKSDF